MADGTRIGMYTGFDEDSAQQVLRTLTQQLDNEGPDNMAGAIADQVVREYAHALAENGSEVTGTGIDSIESEHIGNGVYAVVIARYLDAVERGRSSGNHPPVSGNTRLQRAARKYGIDPYALAKSIAEKGTDPHPFKRKALDRVNVASSNIAESELDKMLDSSD